MSTERLVAATELDRTTFPFFRDAILEAETSGAAHPREPRRYPGYPCWPLEQVRPRLWPSLDRMLAQRRCQYPLGEALPSRRQLSRLLLGSHGLTASLGAGPTPSAGGLQALELYVAVLRSGWLPNGVFHYDRAGHHLSQVVAETARPDLEPLVPSLQQLAGGALVWLVVGDGARVQAKYSERGLRFLLLEAGHLLQNLCLLSTSLGLITVPLGGFFERPLARRLQLPDTDVVLYTGVCGTAPGR